MEIQNFDFYIFGKNGKTDLYNKSDEKRLLQEFVTNSKDKLQMTVYRKDSLVYYIYLRKLPNADDFFGICLKFNGIYCTDNKRFFELFEEAKTQIVKEEKILKSDLKGNSFFVTDDFLSNKVEISNLEFFFRNIFRSNFQQDFSPLDNFFDQGYTKQQYVSFQDEPTYIIDNIKKYNYVTITPQKRERSPNYSKFEDRIINFKQKHKWLNWVCWFLFMVVSIYLLKGLKQERFTFLCTLSLEIPLVLVFYFCLFEKFTKGKNELTLAFFSFIVSILGMALTIDDSVYSQSDGNYGNIIKRSFKKENTVDISNSLNQWDSIPNLVFVLDMSGSTQKKKYGNQVEAKELFEDVCIKLSGDTANVKDILNKFLHKKKRDIDYTEYEVYKLKILDIIAHEQETYKNKIHIVCFAGKVDSRKNVDNRKVISFINNLESNKEFIEDNKTNFLRMIKKLTDSYAVSSFKNPSQVPKYTFLFFSDYLHDVEKIEKRKEKRVIEKEINIAINSLYAQQNFSNYFFSSSYPRTNSDSEIDVLHIFKEWANEDSKAHFLGIEDDEYDFMDILPKEVIPIYYEHSYPKYPLETIITFNNICAKTVKISLRSNFENVAGYHHQIAVFEKKTTPIFSSSDVTVSPSNPLTLSFTGRIINNYSSTLLTFQSINHSCSRFDIVFFKDLPGFIRYIIACTIFSLYLFLLSLSVYIVTNIFNRFD